MTNKKTRKAALYIRVSTDEQNPGKQAEALVSFASHLNFKVVKTYQDVASGGSANRPQFRRMLEDAQRGLFSTVLVWSLDRFSREGITSTLSYIRRLKRCGVGVMSYTERWLDTGDEGMGELIIALLSWVAKQERERISERTRMGLKKARNVGKRGKDKGQRRKSGYYLRYKR